MEICSVCQDENFIGARIGADAVCQECIVSGIIPMFVRALKHENDYPSVWGRYRLSPVDFKDYIANSDDFLRLWKEKELEYGTPIGTRLYCGACQTFCCDKDTRRLIRLACVSCLALICSACGAVDENNDHECEEPGNPFEGLTRGKDYQQCPNAKCGARIELKDGCNAMRCPSSSCNRQFCFVCGVEASHSSNHWRAGSKCPRWNQPDAENAHFDRAGPVVVGLQPAAQPTAEDIIAELAELRLGVREDIVDIVDMVQHLEALPPLPLVLDAGERAVVTRLQIEQNMATDLLATQLGVLMCHHQGQVDAMLQVAQAMVFDAEDDGRPLPAFLEAAINCLLKLRINLDIYVWRERVRAALPHYQGRDWSIFTGGVDVHMEAVLAHFPALLRILVVYNPIAEAKLRMGRVVFGFAAHLLFGRMVAVA